MIPIAPIPLETATKENLVKILSERLYPDKLALMAKVDLLSDERRQQAITYIEDCAAYEAELSQLSAPALMELAEDEFDQDKEVEKEKSEQEDNNRFFHDRSSRADYGTWIDREQWSVDEATALLLGKNPDVVNWQTINPFVFKSKFAERYATLRQKIFDAVEASKVHYSRTPAAFLYYASSIGFVLPADLQTLMIASNEPEDDPSAKSPEAQTEEVFSFKKLIEQNRERVEAAI